jgi:hypothetical protein
VHQSHQSVSFQFAISWCLPRPNWSMYLRLAQAFHPGLPGCGSDVEVGEPSPDVNPARTLRILSRWFNAASNECISEQVASVDSRRNASELSFRAEEDVSALTDRASDEIPNKMAKAIKA